MADRYWVGGSGNWSDTARWSASSGGAGGASVPTSADNVIFDAGSNVGTGTFTVTVDGTSSIPSNCADFSTGGAGGALDGAMTLAFGSTGYLYCYGSLTLPASNLSLSVSASTAQLWFMSTTTGKTFTTNGVSIPNGLGIAFQGIGGGWTLGSALTASSSSISVGRGTFDTGNFNITANALVSSTSNARTISFGSSSLTLGGSAGPLDFSTSTNLTFNAGTSSITFTGGNPVLSGGSQTFYNIAFTNNASGTNTINGSSTFNNVTLTTTGSTGIRALSLAGNQIISGVLTLGAANTATRRIQVASSVVGTARTITLNGSLATLADVSFRDITVAGSVATPWTGTRIGDGGGNTNITANAAKTVYWNLASTQNWSATGWATTNNGAPAVNNFPLPQDTATFTEAGAAGTVTVDNNWWIGSIQMADGVSNRTTAFTLATGTIAPFISGSLTLFSSLTLTGSGLMTFVGRNTQTITTSGKTFDFPITFNGIGGTFAFQDALTQGSTRAFTITNGTVQLKASATSTVGAFATSGTNQKFLQSTVAGTQATLSQASGTVSASYLTVKDINATGGATWNAFYSNGNSDAGNNTGWNFGGTPAVSTEVTYSLRSFTTPRRF